MKFLTTICLVIVLSACGSIERTKSTQQPLGQVQLIGPGDVLLRIEHQRSLENAAGKADIFGRKTTEGITEIRFYGVEPDGTIVLNRKDVNIHTNETTLNRNPMSYTTGSSNTTLNGTATTYGSSTNVSGTARTSSSSMTVNTAPSYHIPSELGDIAIKVKPGEKKIPISGYILEILSVTQNSLEYRVIQQP